MQNVGPALGKVERRRPPLAVVSVGRSGTSWGLTRTSAGLRRIYFLIIVFGLKNRSFYAIILINLGWSSDADS